MKKNFWIKKFKTGIQAITTRLGAKPKGAGWQQVFLADDCCNFDLCKNEPVEFKCITTQFYIEFINTENGMVTGIYAPDDTTLNFEEVIPRGIYDIIIYGVPNGQDVYINGQVVGTGDGGDIELSGYDTSSITSIGYCSNLETLEVVVDFLYNQLDSPAPKTPEEIAETFQLRIYSADGLTLYAETTLGGGNNQVLTIPNGVAVKICLNVTDFQTDIFGSSGSNLMYGGSQFVNRPPISGIGESCDSVNITLPTTQYRVTTAGQPLG